MAPDNLVGVALHVQVALAADKLHVAILVLKLVALVQGHCNGAQGGLLEVDESSHSAMRR